jgi:C2 domain containing protein
MRNYILIGLAFVAMIGISIWLVAGSGSSDTQSLQQQAVSGVESNASAVTTPPPPPPLEKTDYIADSNASEDKNSFIIDENAVKQAQQDEEEKKKLLKAEQEMNAKLQELRKQQAMEEQKKMEQAQEPTKPAVSLIKKQEKEEQASNADKARDFIEEQKFVDFIKSIKGDIVIYPDKTFKFKNKIYQANDKFQDKYLIESVDSISIRFQDKKFAYSLRFIEE